MNEKTIKIIIGVGGFAAGVGSGIGGTLYFMKRKKGPKFHGKTLEEIKFERNKKRAERKAKKEEVVKATVEVEETKEEEKAESVKEPEPEATVVSAFAAPYTISDNVYYNDNNPHILVSLDFYMGDDTFALNNEVVIDTLEFAGEQVANMFHAVNVSDIRQDVIYIRNDILGRDYEITFHFESYAEEILGIDPGDDYDNPDLSDIDYDALDDEEEDDDFLSDPLLGELEGPGEDDDDE